jgi:hypothetical protein
MCRWADETGFDAVRFLEHHGSDDGYAVTTRHVRRGRRLHEPVRIRARAFILPSTTRCEWPRTALSST